MEWLTRVIIAVGLLTLAGPIHSKTSAPAIKKLRKVAQEVKDINISANVINDNTELEIVKKGAHQTYALNIPTGYKYTQNTQTETTQYFIFVYQYETFEGGGSQFLVIDKANLKLLRRKAIRSFNISEPLVYDDVFFIAAAGYAAEFELATGKVNWEHSNLFGRPHYFDGVLNGQSIEVSGDLVRFGPSFTVNRRTKRIVIEDSGQ